MAGNGDAASYSIRAIPRPPPVILTRLITRHYYEIFIPEGIEYKSSRTSDSILIHLRVNDENDTNDRNSFI